MELNAHLSVRLTNEAIQRIIAAYLRENGLEMIQLDFEQTRGQDDWQDQTEFSGAVVIVRPLGSLKIVDHEGNDSWTGKINFK